jgi:hypothetical protein
MPVAGAAPPAPPPVTATGEAPSDEKAAQAQQAEADEEDETSVNEIISERMAGEGGEDYRTKKEKDDEENMLPLLEPAVCIDEPDLPTRDELGCHDLWGLSVSRRRAVYRHWVRETYRSHQEDLTALCDRYARNCNELQRLQHDLEMEVLSEARVIGMTTTAVAKYQPLLSAIKPEVIVVEEAAEVLEAHIVTALTGATKHLILIGDHQQLRPGTAVYRLATHYNLDVSLFERLVRNGVEHVTLSRQRRMRPEISKLVVPIYPTLTDHPDVHSWPNIRGMQKDLFFLDHTEPENRDSDTSSKSNSFEAEFLVCLCGYILRQVSGWLAGWAVLPLEHAIPVCSCHRARSQTPSLRPIASPNHSTRSCPLASPLASPLANPLASSAAAGVHAGADHDHGHVRRAGDASAAAAARRRAAQRAVDHGGQLPGRRERHCAAVPRALQQVRPCGRTGQEHRRALQHVQERLRLHTTHYAAATPTHHGVFARKSRLTATSPFCVPPVRCACMPCALQRGFYRLPGHVQPRVRRALACEARVLHRRQRHVAHEQVGRLARDHAVFGKQWAVRPHAGAGEHGRFQPRHRSAARGGLCGRACAARTAGRRTGGR